MFTYHPTTLEDRDLEKDLEVILNVLLDSGIRILFTYANADNGGMVINQKIENFCKLDIDKYNVVKNLGQLRYLSAMKYVDFLIGNSSSGIIEAASFYKPVVNIGNRQSGRLKGLNVIDCSIKDLKKSIKLALSDGFIKKCSNQKNVYGDGRSATRIVDELSSQPLSLLKKFVDI